MIEIAENVRALSQEEYRTMEKLFNQYKIELGYITRNFYKLLDDFMIYFGNRDTQKTAEYKHNIDRWIERLLQLTRGETTRVAKLEEAEEEEIKLLQKQLPRMMDRLRAEKDEEGVYRNVINLLVEKANHLDRLRGLVDTVSERNLNEIRETRHRFEVCLNELATQMKNIMSYEERMRKKAA